MSLNNKEILEYIFSSIFIFGKIPLSNVFQKPDCNYISDLRCEMILFSKESVAIDLPKEKLYLQKLLGTQGCKLEDFNCVDNQFSFKFAYPPTVSLWKVVSCIKTGVRRRLKGKKGRFWDNIYCLVSEEGNKSAVLENVKVYLD